MNRQPWLTASEGFHMLQTALCCSHGRCRLWKVNADTQVFSESAEGKIYLPLPVGFKAHAKMVL